MIFYLIGEYYGNFNWIFDWFIDWSSGVLTTYISRLPRNEERCSYMYYVLDSRVWVLCLLTTTNMLASGINLGSSWRESMTATGKHLDVLATIPVRELVLCQQTCVTMGKCTCGNQNSYGEKVYENCKDRPNTRT